MKYFLLLIFMVLTSRIAQGQYIITVAGDDTTGFAGDGGPAITAKLNEPSKARPDHAGNLYIADGANNRIRKVNTAGIITTIAGTGDPSSGDGGPATAAGVEGPVTVIADAFGNIYLSDDGSGTGPRIRKIDAAGIITTFAGGGAGAAGSGDGGLATAAAFGRIADIALDRAGNMYIVDASTDNVRKINTVGLVGTIAGNGTAGYSGNGGPATSAQLYQPEGIAVDDSGNLYIADSYNGVIRKVDTAGTIITIAGTDTLGFSGDGGLATAAELNFPYGVAVDSIGNIYIADFRNGRIRKIDITGRITTIAGDSVHGFSGDGGLATAAELFNPNGVALDDSGNIYITDRLNNDVRKITDHLPPSGVKAPPGLAQGEEMLRIYPSPNEGVFTVVLSANTSEPMQVTITDIIGQKIREITTTTNIKTDVQLTAPPGMYFINAVTEEGMYSGKVVVE